MDDPLETETPPVLITDPVEDLLRCNEVLLFSKFNLYIIIYLKF